MSPKRGDRAAPPPGEDEWDVRFANGEAAKGWEQLSTQAASNTRAAWYLMRTDPARPPEPNGTIDSSVLLCGASSMCCARA